jgi:heme/copper-type cytochrome/quinol oxidase subunit 2
MWNSGRPAGYSVHVTSARRASRNLSYSAWVLLAAILAALAGAELTRAVANARSGRLIALGAVALLVSLMTFYVALRRLREKPVRGGTPIAVVLTTTAPLLVLLLVVISFLNGPS